MAERCRKQNLEFTGRQTWLSRIRQLLAAKLLLHETEWPIYRIADTLGFSETASFRHAFVRWSGVSPSQFRA